MPSLKDGEHVFLLSATKERLMTAVYVACEPGEKVHNETLAIGMGKFRIEKVHVEHTHLWKYDPDLHCADAYICWRKNAIEQKNDIVLRRPEYSLERIIDPEKLLEYQVHYINCNQCLTGCELSGDRVYMQWQELKRTPAQETPKKKRQPRKKNNRNLNKRLKLEGKAYKTRKGKEVPAVAQMEFVTCKCKNKCADNFPAESRKMMYTKFWEIPDYSHRRQFIIDRVIPGSKRQVTVAEESRKSKTWHYFLDQKKEDRNERTEVCRIVFYKTLQVKEKFVRCALSTSEAGVAKGDARGGIEPKNKSSKTQLEEVQQHINMFPKVESHYARKDSKKHYIADTSNFSKLTLCKMHNLYKQWCSEQALRPVSYDVYRAEFHKLNLALHKPKKDQCKTCTAYSNNEAKTDEHKSEQRRHIEKKNQAHELKEKMKKIAKEKKDTIAITFDLEAVLYTPCSKVSTLFYKRKLCTYNLTMFNLANKEGNCYIWDETTAKRGSNEIGSGLLMFCEQHQNIKRLFMISDACGGQTRNQFIASLCLYLVRKMPNLEQIDHMFMVSGHSHMEVDSMHARIENKSDTLNIYVPNEWAVVASIARKNPYVVKVLEQECIKDLKRLQTDMRTTNVKRDTEGNTVHWTSGPTYSSNDVISWLQYRKDEPNKIFYRKDYDESKAFKEILVYRKVRNDPLPKLYPAYDSVLPISAAKLRDLQQLCHDLAIPKSYHAFYNGLISNTDGDEDSSDESD